MMDGLLKVGLALFLKLKLVVLALELGQKGAVELALEQKVALELALEQKGAVELEQKAEMLVLLLADSKNTRKTENAFL